MKDAVTTNAAATAILIARMRRNQTSGDMTCEAARRDRWSISTSRRPCDLPPHHARVDWQSTLQGLVDHAVALGKLEKLGELVIGRVGLDLEGKSDLRKPDWRVLGDAQRPAKVEIAFRGHRSGLERNIEGGRHRLEGDSGAGDQRLQQHVAGAQFEP